MEEIPNELQSFATDIAIFLHCLNEFPEFTDENMNAAIFSCEQDLTVSDISPHIVEASADTLCSIGLLV